MPNIEIHGFLEATGWMREQVTLCLKFHLPPKEVVISGYGNAVFDLTKNPRPYLRVFCTDTAEAKQVVDLLAPLKVDTEVILLHAFIPAPA